MLHSQKGGYNGNEFIRVVRVELNKMDKCKHLPSPQIWSFSCRNMIKFETEGKQTPWTQYRKTL